LPAPLRTDLLGFVFVVFLVQKDGERERERICSWGLGFSWL